MSPLATTLLATLLSLGPPINIRRCLQQRIERITQDAQDSSTQTGVPMALLLAVGWTESHLGCDSGEGGNWGAPISRFRRHTAGGPIHAARALAWGYRRCHTWDRALDHFRVGLCVPTRRANARPGYPASATHRIARRLTERLGLQPY